MPPRCLNNEGKTQSSCRKRHHRRCQHRRIPYHHQRGKRWRSCRRHRRHRRRRTHRHTEHFHTHQHKLRHSTQSLATGGIRSEDTHPEGMHSEYIRLAGTHTERMRSGNTRLRPMPPRQSPGRQPPPKQQPFLRPTSSYSYSPRRYPLTSISLLHPLRGAAFSALRFLSRRGLFRTAFSSASQHLPRCVFFAPQPLPHSTLTKRALFYAALSYTVLPFSRPRFSRYL